jgi:membrane protein DedA with SNARE-associated domain
MPFGRFTILTLIGSIPWVLALAIAGHAVGGDWTSVRKGFEYVDYVVLVLIVVGIVYAVLRRRREPSPKAEASDPSSASSTATDIS